MKPLLERKRRARINGCLDELKELMECLGEQGGGRMQRLEKADVLEVTVNHLRGLKAEVGCWAGRRRPGTRGWPTPPHTGVATAHAPPRLPGSSVTPTPGWRSPRRRG